MTEATMAGSGQQKVRPRQPAQPVRAVLFDLDGTLVDSAPDLGGAADAMRIARGLPALPLERYRPMAGAGARGMLGVAFGLTPDDPGYAALRDEFFDAYERRMTLTTAPFDGVAQLLAALASRPLPWGIVTNKIERFALPLARAIAPLDRAGAVIGGDTTAHAKPHPEPLLEAARRLRVDPASCVYVGDDERDIVAGRAAGMFTVAAAWGYLGLDASGKARDARHWGADFIADRPADLLHWLQQA